MYYPSNSNHLPVHRSEEDEDQQYRRHRSARYYAHRVKESLTTRISKLICTIFLFILFVAGLITFILWLSLRPHRPRFHVEDFQISGFDQSNGFQNAVATYNLTIRNSDRKIAVHYDTISATVYYRGQNLGGGPISTESFDHQPKTTKVFSGSLSGLTMTTETVGWGEFLNDRNAGSVVLKFEITSVIKFEIYRWDTKRHKMHADCEVGLGSNGLLLDSYRDKRCSVSFT